MRAFVGCLLDMTATRRLMDAQRGLRARLTESGWSAAWVPPPNLHLTLKFLGEIDVGLAPALGDELARIASRFDVLRPEILSIDAFPDRASPRVLYATFGRGVEPLTALARELETACTELGLSVSQQPFRPHVTLARVKHAGDPKALAQASASAFGQPVPARVSAITLYRSDLLKTGAEYHAVSTHALRTAGV